VVSLINLDMYAAAIPAVPEPNPHRKVDQGRLRDIRKRLEGQCTAREIESIFHEIMDDAVDLSSGIYNLCRLYRQRGYSESS
jgi:hypothetical protein